MSSCSSGLADSPSKGLMVSFASIAPLYRIKTATARPMYPSTFQSVSASTTAASRTAPVEIASLRLSAAVARTVDEPMWFPSLVLNRDSHSFTKTEPTSTAIMGIEASTAVGCRIFPTEVFASSKPITTIMAATARPDRYSKRAWP